MNMFKYRDPYKRDEWRNEAQHMVCKCKFALHFNSRWTAHSISTYRNQTRFNEVFTHSWVGGHCGGHSIGSSFRQRERKQTKSLLLTNSSARSCHLNPSVTMASVCHLSLLYTCRYSNIETYIFKNTWQRWTPSSKENSGTRRRLDFHL